MRRGLLVTALTLAAWASPGCGSDVTSRDECEDDEQLCPPSLRVANEVTCDCRCETGTKLLGTRAYEGAVTACLPPRLNVRTASPLELRSLQAMAQTQFNQSVFKVCSESVAHFLEDVIQQRIPDERLVCVARPARCSCKTRGATEASNACSFACEDVPCDAENCYPVLRKGGGVDARACLCTRVSTCGNTSPPADEPPLCMNRLISVRKGAD